MVRPSEWIRAIFSGAKAPSEAPEPVRSWLRLAVFHETCQLLQMTDKQQKEQAAKYPPEVRDLIRVEYAKIKKSRKLQTQKSPH